MSNLNVTTEDFITFLNKRLEDSYNKDRTSGLCLSETGKKSIRERFKKSIKNGGYSQEERDYIAKWVISQK